MYTSCFQWPLWKWPIFKLQLASHSPHLELSPACSWLVKCDLDSALYLPQHTDKSQALGLHFPTTINLWKAGLSRASWEGGEVNQQLNRNWITSVQPSIIWYNPTLLTELLTRTGKENFVCILSQGHLYRLVIPTVNNLISFVTLMCYCHKSLPVGL